MKANLITILFIGISYISYNQIWGKCTFGQYTNEAVDVEVDANNNTYITGYLSGETAFEFSSVVPNALGNGDIYVAKYDANGTLLWKKTFGGSFSDRAVDLAIGPDNNIVITGQFFGTFNFDAIPISSVNNTKDIFLAKLDPSGNTIWARSEGGTMSDNAYGVTVDQQNNVILTGQFQQTALIAGTSYTSAIDPNTGLYSFDLFIAKYDSNGNPIWSKNGLADYDDRGLAVATDSQNNIYFTGQFSKTLQFNGQSYPNQGYNIGFLCKLTPSGQTMFFNQMRGGMTLPYDLELNNLDEVVVAGDYLGNLNYYDNSGTHSITNAYDRKIFILKTTSTGAFTWSYSLGSNNEISAKAVSIDNAKNIYVTGFFKCDLSQIQDTSTTIFNSVGFKDLYLLKLNNSGTFSYIKQAGGKMDDEGLGIALYGSNSPYICGSFTKNLNFPNTSSAVTTGNGNHNLHFNFGNNEPFHYYMLGDSTRNSFLTNYINEFTEDYNYFVSPTITDSIEGQIVPYFYSNLTYINDTLHFCTKDSVYYNPGLWNLYGPSYNYLWDNGSTYNKRVFNTTGNYYVTVTRNDACEMTMDSIYAISEPIPVSPLLTDNLLINDSTPPAYNTYHFCAPNSIIINYTQQANTDSITTSNYSGVLFSGVGPYTINQEGNYLITAYNQYCKSYSTIHYNLDEIIPYDTVVPEIIMNNSFGNGDSISVCQGNNVYFSCIDLLTNPAMTYLPDISEPHVAVNWTINGNSSSNYQHIRTDFTPSSSGWYTITCEFVLGYNNLCGLDTIHYSVTRDFYIIVKPLPSWSGSIIGDNVMCPNGSVFLIQTNPIAGFHWSGPGIIWSNNNDSIEVNIGGIHTYSGTLTDTLTGCSKSFSNSHNISLKQAPNILSNPSDGIICPYDSVYMFIPNNYVSYDWIGPEGDTLSITNGCYGDTPGQYYCHIVDNEGCSLTTPPYQLNEYTTPSVFVYPDEFLCDNEQITIQTTYYGNAQLLWSTGATTNQIQVSQPGIYWVQITQCGITTTDTVEIIDGTFSVQISANDSLLCYQETISLIGDYQNGSYEWNDGSNTGFVYGVNLPGTYYATVTNQYGCTAVSNTINIEAVTESNPINIPTIEVCLGNSGTLNTVTPYPITWFSTTDTSVIDVGNTLTINPVNSDTSFLVAALNNYCPPVYSTATIEVMDTLGDFIISGDSILCAQTDGILTINSTGESLLWSVNGINIGTNQTQTISANYLNQGINLVQVSVSNLCYTKVVYDTITVLTIPSLSLTEDSINLCYYDNELATINETYDSIFWNVNGTQIMQQDLLVEGNSSYAPITVYAIDANGCQTLSDTLWVFTSNYYFNANLDFSNYCVGDSGQIQIFTNADSISIHTPWNTFIDTTTISIPIDTIHSGLYLIETWDSTGCHYLDSITIPMYNLPNISILPDSIFCINDVYTFYFPNDTNVYSWTTYGSSTTIPILFDQNLILTATTPQGCIQWDTLVVHTVNCTDPLPNIITPNGDGNNDVFFLDDASSQLNNTLIISNRYGVKILEASPYKNDFDGSDLSDGTYFYVYYPEGLDHPENYKIGFLEIIR